MTSSSLQLTVIGAGTALPAAARTPSCHVLRMGGREAIFDMGAGALARLGAAGVDYRRIETVFISHLHPDHVLDLVMLLQATNATPGWVRTQPLLIAGCRGLRSFLDEMLSIFRDARPESYRLEVVELEAGRRHRIAGLDIEVALTGHTSNSLAFRVAAGGPIFAYSGDAADGPALADLAHGADLFLCEASFLSGCGTPDHLTPAEAARIAEAAGVKHLVLTHTYPATPADAARAEAGEHFSGRITIAADALIVEV